MKTDGKDGAKSRQKHGKKSKKLFNKIKSHLTARQQRHGCCVRPSAVFQAFSESGNIWNISRYLILFDREHICRSSSKSWFLVIVLVVKHFGLERQSFKIIPFCIERKSFYWQLSSCEDSFICWSNSFRLVFGIWELLAALVNRFSFKTIGAFTNAYFISYFNAHITVVNR